MYDHRCHTLTPHCLYCNQLYIAHQLEELYRRPERQQQALGEGSEIKATQMSLEAEKHRGDVLSTADLALSNAKSKLKSTRSAVQVSGFRFGVEDSDALSRSLQAA